LITIPKSLIRYKPNREEEAKCVVCNSGDYEDDDLIVFCSVNLITHDILVLLHASSLEMLWN
jgi:hypothetical protein